MRFNLSLKFILSTILVLTLIMGVTLTLISIRHEELIMTQMEVQAKAIFRHIVLTRRWIAERGGVYVDDALPSAGIYDPLHEARERNPQSGRYINANPTMVSKEISQYAKRSGLYQFHITSLQLMNPENAPDEFETKALTAFDKDSMAEASTVEARGNSRYYRYMAPIFVEESCLRCHEKQGYKIGDVRGGISITLPMDAAYARLKADRHFMVGAGITVTLALMLVLFLITRRLVIAPVNTMKETMARFSKDGDPNIPLLKTGDEIEDLSRSFNSMARSLHEYNSSLQEKINAATRQLMETNENLRQRSHRKSDFIAQLSHELRTPLTSIKGAMDYLAVKMSDGNAGGDHLAFFEMIKKNADRLIRLVNNVLDYERIELGKFEMNFKCVNLKTTFEEVITSFKPLSEERKLRIVFRAEDTVPACVDADRIMQVLTNLVSNALHFSKPSSTVIVNLEARAGSVYAAVQDTGSGVPERDREKIFRQFYTTDVKNGTGLGLAICRGIIEAHDGEIGVESAEDGGSRFWFTIPKDRKDGQNEKETSGSR